MEMEQISQAVSRALSRRDERRDILAERIRQVAEPAMDASRVHRISLDEAGALEYRVPQADCSQWSSRIDFPAHPGRPVLLLVVKAGEVRSLGPAPDCGFFDGHNIQHQVGTTRDAVTGREIRPATVAQLRAVARALPAALASLLVRVASAATAEARGADEAAAALPA